MLPSAHVELDFRRQKAREVETDLPQLESFPLPVNLSAHIKWKAAVFPFHLSRGGRNLRNNRELAVHPRSVFAADWCSELQHGCVDSSHTSLIAKGIWPRFLICRAGRRRRLARQEAGGKPLGTRSRAACVDTPERVDEPAPPRRGRCGSWTGLRGASSSPLGLL